MTTCIIVLMGVSGCGKSTVGGELSRLLGWPFRDADSFHPPANVEKMSRAGAPETCGSCTLPCAARYALTGSL